VKESEHLSRLVERIYDAALAVELWPDALEEVCEFVRGCTANLIWRDTADNATVFHSWGFDPRYQQMYFETYARLDPFFPAVAFIEVGEVFSGGDIIPYEEFRKTRYYREWVRPQGYIDTIAVNLERTATAASSFVVLRSHRQGIVDAEARRRFGLVAPHVRRAASIGKTLDFRNALSTAFSTTFDGLAAAVFLVAADGHVVYRNAKARSLLEAGQILREPGGRLSAADETADHALRAAMAAAVDGGEGQDVKTIAVPLVAKDAAGWVAHLLPLGSGLRRGAVGGQAAAALFVGQTTLASTQPLEAAAKRYGLTPSELRVLAAVTQTGSIAALATRLGISRATVKTHLNHLLAKTGTRRQADLLRLLASQTGPSMI
jgi:DNA-binding CsgD family transcriptional regulator